MKRLAITCAICLTMIGVAAPITSARQAPSQPSAMERLVRQEDARRNDPRLGLAEAPVPQPSAIERLVRQEDARAGDPRLGVAPSTQPTAQTPSVEIVATGGFDWLAAAIGALACAAALLVAAGLAVAARSHGLGRA